MIRASFTLVGYAAVFILGLGVCSYALGAPAKLRDFRAVPIETRDHSVLQIDPPTIHRKCPCWMYQADGFVELAPGGTDIVGPDSTDYSGGHWSSDGTVIFLNRPPKPLKKDD